MFMLMETSGSCRRLQPVAKRSLRGIVRAIFGPPLAMVASGHGQPVPIFQQSSPEVIRLVVMMYVRYPLSLRNVEDLLAGRGIEPSAASNRMYRIFNPQPMWLTGDCG